MRVWTVPPSPATLFDVSFGALLDARRFPVALEITPPQTLLRGVLLRRAGLLGPAASAVNVIQRPGRLSSLDASIALRLGCDRSTVGKTRRALAKETGRRIDDYRPERMPTSPAQQAANRARLLEALKAA